MQEIALFLSSIAGVCTAAAVKKFPKNKKTVTIGANTQIKNQINSLRMEKEILSKTITRLYEDDSGLNKIQRDRLLLRYQHQFGVILAKIEKLEAASKHPDLGPVGEGLITIMDQKLSQLDNRLYELSSKITIANSQVAQVKEISKPKEEIKKPKSEIRLPEKPIEIPKIVEKPIPKIIPTTIPAPTKPVELTTLTEISSRPLEFPHIEQKQTHQNEIVEEILKPQEKIPDKIEIIQTTLKSEVKPKPSQEIPQQITIPDNSSQIQQQLEQNQSKPTIKLPDEEKIDDDEGDLDKIKGEIMKTLSKLEQAEVE